MDRALVVFALDAQRYALTLRSVEGVLRTVAVTPFPRAPDIVSGVVDLHGELVPVLNVRRRFRLPERPPSIRDHLLVARTRLRRVAFVVDGVEGVVAGPPAERVEAGDIVPGLEYVQGVTRLGTLGLVLIHDLDSFLSLGEENALAAAGSA